MSQMKVGDFRRQCRNTRCIDCVFSGFNYFVFVHGHIENFFLYAYFFLLPIRGRRQEEHN